MGLVLVESSALALLLATAPSDEAYSVVSYSNHDGFQNQAGPGFFVSVCAEHVVSFARSQWAAASTVAGRIGVGARMRFQPRWNDADHIELHRRRGAHARKPLALARIDRLCWVGRQNKGSGGEDVRALSPVTWMKSGLWCPIGRIVGYPGKGKKTWLFECSRMGSLPTLTCGNPLNACCNRPAH